MWDLHVSINRSSLYIITGNICCAVSNPRRGHKEVRRRSTGHTILLTIRYSNQQDSKWRHNNFQVQPQREHGKLIRDKIMSLGTNYSFYCLEFCRIISESDLQATVHEDCLICFTNPPNKPKCLCDTLEGKVYRRINVKTVHKKMLLLHIESNPDRLICMLGVLSPIPTVSALSTLSNKAGVSSSNQS